MTNKTLKVLQVVVSAGSKKISGPERRTLNLLRYYSKTDIEIFLIYPQDGALNKEFSNSGVQLINHQIKNRFDLLSIWYYYKLIKLHKIELIHSQGAAANDLVCAIAARLSGIKSIITRPVLLKDQIHYGYIKRFIYEFIDSLITLRLAHQIITVSEMAMHSLVNRNFVPKRKIKLIYNGVNFEKYNQNTSSSLERINPKNTYTIGMVAHLSVFKGLYDFIDILTLLKEKGISFKAKIAGDGEMRSSLEKLINERELSSFITLLGKVEDPMEFYKTLDVFLFPSHREGLSVAVLEAMASGLPIVLSNVGAAKEQITEGKNGFVIEKGNIASFVNALIKLNNISVRKNFGIESRKIVSEKFDEKKMFLEYRNLYYSLTND